MAELDLIVKNVQVVRPNQDKVEKMDLGIKDGKFVKIAPEIKPDEANEVFDGENKLAFPGVIDAHTHVGIYKHISEDAPTETAAAAMGGVTTMITYFRSGGLYLDKGGSYKEFIPELLQLSEGKYNCDYGYHIAPVQGIHVKEMEYLLQQGITTFKIFMFYGLHGLHGKSDQQSKWLRLDEGDDYNLVHFEFIMREAARLQEKYPELADYISVSLHCETPEMLKRYATITEDRTDISGLSAYSDARPPHSESMAVAMAGHLAHITGCKNINLLHLTSKDAIDAAETMRRAYPEINFGFETTAGHLLLDAESCPMGVWAKVNPPIRPKEDVEYLWEKVKDGTIEWVITDHANCPKDQKVDKDDPDNIWKAKAGFGGVEYLLHGMFSEGTKRGLSPNKIAELVSWNPSRRFGLLNKGDIDIGFDADLALLDPNEEWTIHHEDSPSSQGYTPFEGIDVKGRVKNTFLRGNMVFDNGKVVGDKIGKFVKRPTK
ncbi:dihydroorotase family protein [Spirochaetota bacterium]